MAYAAGRFPLHNLGTSRGPDKIGSRAAWPAGRVLHVVGLVILEGGRVLEWSDSVCNKPPYRQLVH